MSHSNRILWLSLIIILIGLNYSCKSNHRDKSDQLLSNSIDGHDCWKEGKYNVVNYPTDNKSRKKNKVEGVVLHHTGIDKIETSLKILTKHTGKNRVSCHVLIDKDGTRYLLAAPKDVTWHSGYSRHNGKNNCNDFMIGVEFQGNTNAEPLTNEQIESAIDYLTPLIKKYNIKRENIVTHKIVRDNWLRNNSRNKQVPQKVDINQLEYERLMKVLEKTNYK